MELTQKKKKSAFDQRLDFSSLNSAKVPPQAAELEAAVLGAIMLEPQSLSDVLGIIPGPDCFYSDANQRIYKNIQEIEARGGAIDFITVTEQLRKNSELELVGGSYYVTSLTRDVVSSAHIEEHSRIVVEKYILRELIRMGGSVIKEAYEDSTDVFDLLDEAEKILYTITEKHLRRTYSSISQLLSETMDEIEQQTKNKDDINGVPSGFTELDKLTAGWQRSNLIVLAARPSVGKTAFSLNLALNAAMHPQKPTGVAVFSLEMGATELVKRLLSAVSDIPLSNITRGNLTDTELRQIASKMQTLAHSNIYIDDQPALNIFELRAKARRLKNKHDIGLIVIDYLQLMSGAGGNKNTNREQEISKISRDLKELAKELRIPIIALSQLNRNIETRSGENRTPKLSDLRESGAIEQDADMVIFLSRPDYYEKPGSEEQMSSDGLTEINIAKHRNGRTDTIQLKFHKEYQLFTDWKTGGGNYPTPSRPNAGMSDSHINPGPALDVDTEYTNLPSRANDIKPEEDKPADDAPNNASGDSDVPY